MKKIAIPFPALKTTMKHACLFLFMVVTCSKVSAEDRIQFWVRAFIPATHPTNPSLTQPIPGRPGETMIEGPTPGDEWFATNSRQFSDKGGSSKLETNFILVIGETSAKVEKVAGQPIHASGKSELVNRITGKTISTRDGILRLAAIGEAMVSGEQAQIIFQAAAVNPYAPPGVSPSVDYSMDFLFDRSKRTLRLNGSIGRFPAYEAYASLNGGPICKLFTQDPSGDTPWSLYDFGTGIGDRQVAGTVTLPELSGSWVSTDPQHRFRLEFGTDHTCNWIEKGVSGEVARRVPVEMRPSIQGPYVIYRPNTDSQVLTNLGFAAAIQPAILAAGPKPSYMTIARSGAILKCNWSGLTVIKSNDGKFKELKQPGTSPEKYFEFSAAP